MQTTPEMTGREPMMTTDGDRPFGPVAAAFLAAGVAAVVLGVLTTVAEASEGFASALQWSDAVGPLMGKAIISVVVFVVAWVILHVLLRDSDPEPGKVFLWTAVLVAVGLVLTFPVFFDLFKPE